MKKVIFTLLFFGISIFGFSQTTYYWVGGANGAWTAASSWSTTVGGPSAAAPTSADIVIFDGSNIGGGATGQVTPLIASGFTVAQLKLQNAANVVLQRGSGSGTLTMVINGDVTPSGGTTDFTIDATSNLTLTATTSGFSIVFQLGTTTTIATGSISGTISINDANIATIRISVQNANALAFEAGSVMNSTQTFGSSYPFGNSTGGVSGGVEFKAGSSFVFKGTINPYSNSTLNNFYFDKGGNFIFEANNPTGILSNGRILANVVVRNNATVTADGNFFNIDTLTTNVGATFNIRGSSTSPFSGDIINNGTFGAGAPITSSNLIMYGTVPQNIKGTGTFNALGALSVATGSNVTLERSLVLSGSTSSTVTGKINFKTNTITGTNTWNAKAANVTNFTGDVTSGSNSITNLSVFSGIGIGSVVVGPNIPAGAIIIATSLGAAPGGNVTISKPATVTAAGVALTGSNTSPTLETANLGGIDASVATGTKSFGDGTSYIFDGVTTSPFPTSSNNTVGDITVNTNITSNKVIYTKGVVTLNSAKFTIRGGDELHLTTAASFGGTYNSSQYIATDVSGSTVGVVTIDTFTTTKTFPVGTPTYYMPVVLTPASQSTFAVSMFQGITEDGTPAGTPFTPTKKASVVDAVWTINRMAINGVDSNCTMTLNWPQALEGSAFTTFPNNQVGISKNNGGTWIAASGSGNNTNNTATSTFNSFSPFAVGQVGVALPIKLTNIVAKEEQGKIKLQWNNEFETNTYSYEIERSQNGISFTQINNVLASGIHQYTIYDNNPFSTNYYRIAVKDINGNIAYSNIVRINLNNSNAEISVYPNPVKGGELNLQLSNLAKGTVQLSLYNTSGQRVLLTSVEYNGGVQTQTIKMPSTITKGTYQLVIKTNAETINQSLLVQ